MKMDLKKFRKVYEDGGTTVMQHPRGHSIVLSHSELSPEHVEGLRKLSMAPKEKKMSEGGGLAMLRKKKEGNANPKLSASKQEAPKEDKPVEASPVKMADGGEVADNKSIMTAADEAPVQNQLVPAQVEATPTPADVGVNEIPQSQIASDIAGATENAPQAPTATPPSTDAQSPNTAPPDASNANPYAAGMNALQQGMEQYGAGATAEAKAVGELGQKQAAQRDQAIQQRAELEKTNQHNLDWITKEYQDVTHDIRNNLIDPKHYLGEMGAGGKVATAIGLFLGGIGSGITGQSNPAMDFLNKQIDRDIEAQKANLGARENLLGAAFKQFGNMHDATQFTRMVLESNITDQIAKQADLAQSPIAKAKAQMIIGQMQASHAQEIGQMALRRSVMEHMGGDNVPGQIQGYRMLGMEPMAKDLEARYIPGVGVAQVPAPQEVRDRLTGMQTFQEKAQKLQEFAKKHAGTVLDRATVNEGKTLAADASAAYRQATHGGVYKAGEQEFINHIIPEDPTAFLNPVRVQSRLKAIQDSVRSDQNVLHKNLGLPPVQASAASNPHEGKILIQKGTGKRFILKNGVPVPYGR